MRKIARALTPSVIFIAFSTAAHAQGSMDFSGATTLMTTFKTFCMYAGAVICLVCLVWAGIKPFRNSSALCLALACWGRACAPALLRGEAFHVEIFTRLVFSASRVHDGTTGVLDGAGRQASSAFYREPSAPIRELRYCVPPRRACPRNSSTSPTTLT